LKYCPEVYSAKEYVRSLGSRVILLLEISEGEIGFEAVDPAIADTHKWALSRALPLAFQDLHEC
jgi:hypothetical protein